MRYPFHMKALWPAPIIAAFTLMACSAETDPGPGGVSKGDAKALDEAAKTLDERQANPGKQDEAAN
jgi:hypothetical protein